MTEYNIMLKVTAALANFKAGRITSVIVRAPNTVTQNRDRTLCNRFSSIIRKNTSIADQLPDLINNYAERYLSRVIKAHLINLI